MFSLSCLRIVALATVAASAFVVAPGTALAGTAAVTPAELSQEGDTLLAAAYPADGPGASAIVMRGGKVIYASGRGLADLKSSRPITPDTVFRLGSITKQFTAAVILKLVAEGRISLDDPLSRFFPDWPQPGAKATVRQLLNHSSGVQDYTKIPGWMRDNLERPHTTAELVSVIRDKASPTAPGTSWEYNNGGYLLLSAIIEKVTDKPWHENVEQRIARPLGLKSITYAVTGESGPQVASLHTSEAGKQIAVPRTHMSVASGAGALIGSVRDLAKWAKALHHGRVVSPALYQEMTRPMRLLDGTEHNYGFALRTDELRGRPVLKHGGSGRGFRTASTYVPSEDLFVAVFANSDEPATPADTMVVRLAALAMGEAFPAFTPVELDMAAVEPLLGLYKLDDGPPRRFFARDGKLFIGRGEQELPVFPAGEDRFFLGADEVAWFRIVWQPGGAHRMEMQTEETRQPQLAVRTGAVPDALKVPDQLLKSYVGVFKTDGGPVLTIALDAQGKLTLQPPNQAAFEMRAVAPNEFMVDAARSKVVFHQENGAVDRLTVHRGARRLEGRRQP